MKLVRAQHLCELLNEVCELQFEVNSTDIFLEHSDISIRCKNCCWPQEITISEMWFGDGFRIFLKDHTTEKMYGKYLWTSEIQSTDMNQIAGFVETILENHIFNTKHQIPC